MPVVLKGPLMSFFNFVSVHLKLARVGHLLHAGERPGSPRCPLSIVYSTWSAIKTHVNVIIVPADEVCTVAEMLVRHSILIRPSSTYVRVTCCLRPTYEVPMAKKSSRVSHTNSQMVRTCCLRSPSAGLRLPPQLTSNCLGGLVKKFLVLVSSLTDPLSSYGKAKNRNNLLYNAIWGRSKYIIICSGLT